LWVQSLDNLVARRFHTKARVSAAAAGRTPSSLGLGLKARNQTEREELKTHLHIVLNEVRRDNRDGKLKDRPKPLSKALASKLALDEVQIEARGFTFKRPKGSTASDDGHGRIVANECNISNEATHELQLSSSLKDLVLDNDSEDTQAQNVEAQSQDLSFLFESASSIECPGRPRSLVASASRALNQDINEAQPQRREGLLRGYGEPESARASDESSDGSRFARSEETQTTSPESPESLSTMERDFQRKLDSRLEDIWPPMKISESLAEAPLPIVWEVHRVLLHCGLESSDFKISHDPAWDTD
jgi:hypothetical protein